MGIQRTVNYKILSMLLFKTKVMLEEQIEKLKAVEIDFTDGWFFKELQLQLEFY